MEIRLLSHGDEALLANVADAVFDHPLNASAAAEFLADPRHRLVAAIDDGAVVGFASAVIYVHPDKAAPELWINEVGVAASHRRRGLGRALMDELLAVGKRERCSVAWVLTEDDNTAARELYARCGGEETTGVVMYSFLM